MKEKSTKILIPTIVAVITLIVLVVGATYAYFTVGATNNFETRTIEASADSVGVVTLTSNENNLYLNIPAHFMMQQEASVTYYGVTDPDGLPVTDENKESYIPATFTLTGGSENQVYQCSADYNLTIEGTMYDSLREIDDCNGRNFNLILYSPDREDESEIYWLSHEVCGVYEKGEPIECNSDFSVCSDTIEFDIGGEKGNTYTLDLSLGIQNQSNVDQTSLAGTSMTAEFDITDFSCTAIS